MVGGNQKATSLSERTEFLGCSSVLKEGAEDLMKQYRSKGHIRMSISKG